MLQCNQFRQIMFKVIITKFIVPTALFYLHDQKECGFRLNKPFGIT